MDDAPDLFPLDDWPLIKRWHDCTQAGYPWVPVTWDEAEEFRPQLNAFTKAFKRANQERAQAGQPPYTRPEMADIYRTVSIDGDPDELMTKWRDHDELMTKWRDNPPTEKQFWSPDE